MPLCDLHNLFKLINHQLNETELQIDKFVVTKSRLTVVSRNFKKKQHVFVSSSLCDHYSE